MIIFLKINNINNSFIDFVINFNNNGDTLKYRQQAIRSY